MIFLQHWLSVLVTFLPVVIPMIGIYGIALAGSLYWNPLYKRIAPLSWQVHDRKVQRMRERDWEENE